MEGSPGSITPTYVQSIDKPRLLVPHKTSVENPVRVGIETDTSEPVSLPSKPSVENSASVPSSLRNPGSAVTSASVDDIAKLPPPVKKTKLDTLLNRNVEPKVVTALKNQQKEVIKVEDTGPGMISREALARRPPHMPGTPEPVVPIGAMSLTNAENFLRTLHNDISYARSIAGRFSNWAKRHPTISSALSTLGLVGFSTGIGVGANLLTSNSNTKDNRTEEIRTLSANLTESQLKNRDLKVMAAYSKDILSDAILTGKIPTHVLKELAESHKHEARTVQHDGITPPPSLTSFTPANDYSLPSGPPSSVYGTYNPPTRTDSSFHSHFGTTVAKNNGFLDLPPRLESLDSISPLAMISNAPNDSSVNETLPSSDHEIGSRMDKGSQTDSSVLTLFQLAPHYHKILFDLFGSHIYDPTWKVPTIYKTLKPNLYRLGMLAPFIISKDDHVYDGSLELNRPSGVGVDSFLDTGSGLIDLETNVGTESTVKSMPDEIDLDAARSFLDDIERVDIKQSKLAEWSGGQQKPSTPPTPINPSSVLSFRAEMERTLERGFSDFVPGRREHPSPSTTTTTPAVPQETKEAKQEKRLSELTHDLYKVLGYVGVALIVAVIVIVVFISTAYTCLRRRRGLPKVICRSESWRDGMGRELPA